MLTSQAVLDALAVVLDVLFDARAEGFAAGDDRVPAAGGAHPLRGEVGVRPCAVPVALDGLGVKVDVDVELLGDAL